MRNFGKHISDQVLSVMKVFRLGCKNVKVFQRRACLYYLRTNTHHNNAICKVVLCYVISEAKRAALWNERPSEVFRSSAAVFLENFYELYGCLKCHPSFRCVICELFQKQLSPIPFSQTTCDLIVSNDN